MSGIPGYEIEKANIDIESEKKRDGSKYMNVFVRCRDQQTGLSLRVRLEGGAGHAQHPRHCGGGGYCLLPGPGS